MTLSVGIVGLPNVGKSTLFQALTKKQVDIANYPFTTIKPNVGVVEVPDERLAQIGKAFKSAEIVPAVIEFVDIAGLVRGAHKGEGLGNQFLAAIREVAAVVQVVRCFQNGDITHVEQTVDPLRDIETVSTELALKDLESAEKGSAVPESQLLSKKPVIYLLNCNLSDVSEELLKKIQEKGGAVVTANLKDELDMQALSAGELGELGFASQLPEFIRKAYEILDLITFFTGNENETRAWPVKRGTDVVKAAGLVHTDFEKNFIKAEVIVWEKLLEAGSWQQAAANGWIRTEGKEYVVQEGDVIEVKSKS